MFAKFDTDAIGRDAIDGIADRLRAIAYKANRNTTAAAGVTVEVDRNAGQVTAGPTGAAGLPVEIGTRSIAARRYFKRELDRGFDR